MAVLLKLTGDVSTGSGSYINKSGFYPITINFASVEANKNGNVQVNFNYDYNGNSGVIFGPYIQNAQGAPIKMGVEILEQLGQIAGMSVGDALTIEEETHKVGKDGKAQTFNVISEFSGLDVIARMQQEYSKYNGEIRERMNIREFYRASDNASASEIISGSEVGAQYAKAQAYKDDITKTDVTQEEIDTYIAAKAEARKGSSTTAAPAAATKPKTSLFAKKA